MNLKKQGAKLEIYVEQLFKDMCKFRVRRNVVYSINGRFTKRRRQAQIDVEFWDLLGKTIVECKYYDGNVSARDVREFNERKKKVFHNHAMMISNSDYTESAKELANKYGIKLVNGEQLRQMDYERLTLIEMVIDNMGKRKGLEDQIKDIDLRKYRGHYSVKQYIL